MLVLSRRVDEWIGLEIGREDALAILDQCGKIRVDVLLIQLQEDKARLGFAADKRIAIHRQEIWDDINLKLSDPKEDDTDDLAEITRQAF